MIKPPPIHGSSHELDQYFSKHSLNELEKAGIAKELSSKEQKWLDGLTASVKEVRKRRAQLNLAFAESELSRFTLYADRKHMPASTLARAWILERLDQELRNSK